jgi:hypothetical protein
MSLRQVLLQSARVAELRHRADDLARAARPPARIVLTGDPKRDRRRLGLLLLDERRKNAKLRATIGEE